MDIAEKYTKKTSKHLVQYKTKFELNVQKYKKAQKALSCGSNFSNFKIQT